MKKTIVSFVPHKTALTVAILSAISSLIFLLPMAVIFSVMPATDENGNPVDMGMPLSMVLVMPVIYFVFGYIFTAISAVLYNQVAKITGGIQMNVADVDTNV